MEINELIGIAEHPLRADKSEVCAINRHLPCHPEGSEGSVALGREMLRCAQDDSAVTYPNAGIKVVMCMIGPYGVLAQCVDEMWSFKSAMGAIMTWNTIIWMVGTPTEGR